jgi:hypothetical protein
MTGIVRKPGGRRNKEPLHNSRYSDNPFKRIERRNDLRLKTNSAAGRCVSAG